MGDILRILERFRITGHGIVYTVKILLTAMTAQENYAACINI